jgi:hypothetical protein
MTPSTFIARILGPLLIVMGLGLLLQTQAFRAMAQESLQSPAVIYFSGLITLAVGLAVLNVHNLWSRDWRVIITIFGWLAVIGGIFRLLATAFVQQVGLEVVTRPRGLVVGAVIQLVLGGYLAIMGYQDIWNGGKAAKPHRAAPAKAAKTAKASVSAGTTKRPRRKTA